MALGEGEPLERPQPRSQGLNASIGDPTHIVKEELAQSRQAAQALQQASIRHVRHHAKPKVLQVRQACTKIVVIMDLLELTGADGAPNSVSGGCLLTFDPASGAVAARLCGVTSPNPSW